MCVVGCKLCVVGMMPVVWVTGIVLDVLCAACRGLCPVGVE